MDELLVKKFSWFAQIQCACHINIVNNKATWSGVKNEKKKRITRTEQYQRMKAMATVWRVRRNEFNNSFKHANIHGLFLVHAFGSFSCSFFCYLFFGFPFHFLLIMFLNNRTPLIFFFYIRLDSRTFSSFFKNFLRGDRTYEFSFIGNGLII